jgi:hypothetical protein
VAVLQSLAAKLPGVVLVHGHKGTRELTVLEQAVTFPVESEEKKEAVLLSGGNIKFSQGHV